MNEVVKDKGLRSPFFTADGQSMVEFLVILPVMLLLILATIQIALIYHAKITLNYAAYEGVRAGTLNCNKKISDDNNKCDGEVGQYEAVKEGVARGLAPLYSYYEPNSEKRGEMDRPAENQVEAYQQGRERIFQEFKSKYEYIRIERLNPGSSAFDDFAPDEVIANDNLQYRTSSGGDSSKSSIQSANILHLRITYWYPLYVPLVNKFIFNTVICCKGLENMGSCRWARDPVCRSTNPRIPLTATGAMRMQTPVEESKEYYSSW